MIVCACLVDVREDKILLIRARDNDVWYFPGGKIDANETPKQALVRELKEELDVGVDEQALEELSTVIGPNHDHTQQCKLVCFKGSLQDTMKPQAEISEVAWLPLSQRERMAPLVQKLIETSIQI